MKLLCIAVLLPAICLVSVWLYLVLVVPPMIYPYVNSPVALPNHLKLLMSFSNHARTPLGILVLLMLLGIGLMLLRSVGKKA